MLPSKSAHASVDSSISCLVFVIQLVFLCSCNYLAYTVQAIIPRV